MSKPDFKTLADQEGEMIVAIIPMLHPTVLQKVRLHKVEAAGLWVESQTFLEMAFKQFGVKSSPKTMILFLPWHQITFVLSSLDFPALLNTQL